MTLQPRPQVNIAFHADTPVEEATQVGQFEPWANTQGRRILQAVFLCLLCITAYAPGIYAGEFLPGDDGILLKNPMLYRWENIGVIWTKPHHLPQFSPVGYTAYLIEFQEFHDHPRGYRIISLMLHMSNVLLLLLLTRKLELPGGFLAAALFALHPVQVDAVTWISQQRYLLCAAFYLSALLVYLRRAGLNPAPPPPLPGNLPPLAIGLPENPLALYFMALGLFLGGLFTHVIGATFPLVVLTMIWWERGRITKDDLIPLLPFGLFSIVVCAMATWVPYHLTHTIWQHPAGVDWFLFVGKGLWFYAMKLLIPFGNSFVYQRWIPGKVPAWQWVELVGAIFVVVALAFLTRRFGRGPLATAILFMILLLPCAVGLSDAGSLADVLVYDHALYFAGAAVLVGLSALVVEWLETSKTTSKVAALPMLLPSVGVLVLIPVLVLVMLRSTVYREPEGLWKDVLRGDGDSVVALNTLGKIELERKDQDPDNVHKAEAHFKAALNVEPDDLESMLNLGLAMQNEFDLDAAIARYNEALAKHPESLQAHLLLGNVLTQMKLPDDAKTQYELAKKIDPNNAEVYNNEGLLLLDQHDFDGAIKEYKGAIQRDPRDIAAYLNMANLEYRLGDLAPDLEGKKKHWTEAADNLRKVFEIDPHNYIGLLNAGVMAYGAGDLQTAEFNFHLAVHLNSTSVEAWRYLGLTLMAEPEPPGKMDKCLEAIYNLKRALQLRPNDAGIRFDLETAQNRRDVIMAQNKGH